MDYMAFLGRQNKNEQAETVLNEALARNPSDTRLLTAMARLRLNKQDWVGAQTVAEALKKIGDKSGVSEQIVGAALLGEKKYDQSIETRKDAYTSAPRTGRPMYSLFFAYLQAGKISEAEIFIQSILTANANNADALVLMGSIKMLQKKPQEAEAAYKLAIERQPANPIGYVALSKQYFLQNQLAEAEAVLRRGRDKAPRDLTMNLGFANLLELKNDTDGAIAIYDEQLKTTPDALIIINNLASLLADYRADAASLDKARQLSQRLETADVPQFKDTVGWVAYRKGDYRAALLNLEAAVAKLPGNALVRYHLAMTYGALKRNTDAKDQFAKAEALLKDDDPLKEKIRAAVTSLGASN
jgi:tetratricopeptide (TPR) repeat protein